MAPLRGLSSDSTVGVLITTVAEDGAIKTTQAELTALGATAEKASLTAASGFDKFRTSLNSIGSNMTALGHTMTTFITLPVVGLGIAATKSALDFQQAMTYIRTDAGDTTDNIRKLSDSVLQLARSSQFGPEELAKGLYHLASLGLRGADALKALNTAQQMAAVGGSDLESTASALGGALVTGIRGVQDYSSAAGVLDATIGAGNMRMQDLVNAIGTGVLPVFKNAGLGITDFGAALATLTDNGQEASAAATHLRMTISLMEAPSKAAQKALEDIGLTASSLGMDMQTKGLIPALEDLQKHLLDTYGTTAEGKQKIAAALTEMFGGGRSSSAIQTLLDQLDRVRTKERQIADQSGEFATKVSEQQQTAAAKFKTAWSGIQADFIKLGNDILPEVTSAVNDVARAVGGVTDWFQSLDKGQRQTVVNILASLAVGGPLLIAFGTLAKSISSIIGLVTGVGKAWGIVAKSIETGAVMGQIDVAAALADIYLVYKAVTAVQGAISAMNDATKAAKTNAASIGQSLDALRALQASGTSAQQQRATKAINQIQSGIQSDLKDYANNQSFLSVLAAGVRNLFASGTNYAPGGWSIVGEHGPEAMYVPQGTMIKTAPQTSSLGNSSGGISLYQTNNNYSTFDLTQANRQLAWQLSNAIG